MNSAAQKNIQPHANTVFSSLTFSTSDRQPFQARLPEKANIVEMPLPAKVTFDKGRCAAFADRITTFYEDGRLKPILRVDNQEFDLNSITIVASSRNAAIMKITCDCGAHFMVDFSDNTHRLVQYGNKMLSFGWEGKTDQARSGSIHFELKNRSHKDQNILQSF